MKFVYEVVYEAVYEVVYEVCVRGFVVNCEINHEAKGRVWSG